MALFASSYGSSDPRDAKVESSRSGSAKNVSASSHASANDSASRDANANVGAREARGPHVTISGTSRRDHEALLWVAEDALASSRAWLGLPPATPAEALNVRFVADVEGLFAIEAERGWPSSREYFRTHAFHGRCYPAAGLVVLPDSAAISVRWQLVHEIAHAVNAARMGACPTVLDEGLAELVPYWILGTDRPTPESLDCEYELYDRRLSAAVLAREVPTLERLLTVDDPTFHDPASDWLWYALSWKLVKVLVESDDPRVTGRFQRLVDGVASGRGLRDAIADTYDVTAVESEWRRAILATARCRPVFGDWRAEGDALTGRAAAGTSSCTTATRRWFSGESFTIGFTLSSDPPASTGFGFVFDCASDTDFVYVEVRPEGRTVVIAERRLGQWTHATEHEIALGDRFLPIPAGTARRFVLKAGGRGRIELVVDGRTVVVHELERVLAGGEAGWMLEHCATDGVGPRTTEMRFESVEWPH